MAATFDLDKYGSLARESLLADLLEVEAIQSIDRSSRSQFDLADFIRDSSLENKLISGWTHEIYRENDGESDDFIENDQDLSLTRADEQAQRVFDVIRERKRILGDLYPFECEEVVRRAWDTPPIHGYAYLCFLELTVSHAFCCQRLISPTDQFENWCVESFGRLGYKTAGMMSQLDAGTFVSRLKGAADILETVNFEAEQVILRKRQQDAKADLLAIHPFESDDRPGRLIWVGQATCGSSDTWDTKSREVSVEKWKSISCDFLHPSVGLFIPHHAMEVHLASLSQDGSVPVFDRLRLVKLFAPSKAVVLGSLELLKNVEVEAWGKCRPNFEVVAA